MAGMTRMFHMYAAMLHFCQFASAWYSQIEEPNAKSLLYSLTNGPKLHSVTNNPTATPVQLYLDDLRVLLGLNSLVATVEPGLYINAGCVHLLESVNVDG